MVLIRRARPVHKWQSLEDDIDACSCAMDAREYDMIYEREYLRRILLARNSTKETCFKIPEIVNRTRRLSGF